MRGYGRHRFLAGGNRGSVNITVADQFHYAHALHIVVFDYQ